MNQNINNHFSGIRMVFRNLYTPTSVYYDMVLNTEMHCYTLLEITLIQDCFRNAVKLIVLTSHMALMINGVYINNV
jgi:hypothetical protein